MAPYITLNCRNFTLDFKRFGSCVCPCFLQTLGPWFSKWNASFTFIWKDNSWVLSLAQEFLDIVTSAVPVQNISVHGGSWYSDTSFSPLLGKLVNRQFKAAVIPVACASFRSTLSPSSQPLADKLPVFSIVAHLSCGICW